MNNNIDPKKSDDIDLIQLFNYIGRIVSKIVVAFKRFILTLFDKILLFVLLVKKHSVKVIVAIVIGASIGYFIQRNDPKLYSSEMVVHPNYDSTRQLYTSIEYLNQLVRNEEYDRLAIELEIQRQQAESIESIYCEPIYEENNKIKVYDEFISSLRDTAFASKVDYNSFIKSLTDYDNKYHKIIVESSNRDIFEGLQKSIINLISKNEYFERNKKIQDENITKSVEVYNKQLIDIDSLRKVYHQVLLSDVNAGVGNRERGSNVFNFAQEGSKTNELELLKESRLVNDKLIALNEERIRLTSIVNVVSDFNPIGIRVNSLFRNKIIIWGGVFGVFAIVIIMFWEFNLFLERYSRTRGLKL